MLMLMVMRGPAVGRLSSYFDDFLGREAGGG